MYALNLSADGRILSATYPQYASDAVMVKTLPTGDISDYRYVDGAFVYEPLCEDEKDTAFQEYDDYYLR